MRASSDPHSPTFSLEGRLAGILILPLCLKGNGQTILHCVHRTSTVSSCAFCEQEGWSGHSLPILRRPRVARAQKIIRLHPLLLLDRREQPLPIWGSHEAPGFAGFSRYLFAAFDEIAWF